MKIISLKNSFHKKVFMLFIVLGFTPLLLMLSIFSLSYYKNFKTSNASFMNQLNGQVNGNINVLFENTETIPYMHFSDMNMLNILTKKYIPSDYESVNDQRAMTYLINHILKRSSFILGVTFISSNENIYSSNPLRENLYDSTMTKDFLLSVKKEGRIVSPIYYDECYNKGSVQILSIITRLLDPYELKPIGTVYVDIDFDKIKKMFDDVSLKNNASNFVIIESGKVIYNTSKEHIKEIEDKVEIATKLEKSFKNNQKQFSAKIGEEDYFFVVSKNELTNWFIAQYTPTSILRQSLFQNIKIFLIVSMIIIILMVLLGYLASINITKPIERLRIAMKRGEEGTFELIKDDGRRNDEIGLLIKSFNQMATILEDSIQKQLTTEMDKSRIELKMLQAQINPHFLYNTLNLISSIAEIENVSLISVISKSLSSLFRYNIKENDIVELRNEIEQVNNYFIIQKARFLDKINVIYNIEEGLYSCKILKFILQPIVENSVFHGIEKKKNGGFVKISALKIENSLVLEVEDNGPGMSEDILEEINEKLKENRNYDNLLEPQKNIGLLNVHYRIRNYYGKHFGLRIHSELNKGTIVILILPFSRD